jgi:hypothetical protein
MVPNLNGSKAKPKIGIYKKAKTMNKPRYRTNPFVWFLLETILLKIVVIPSPDGSGILVA